MEKGQCVIKSIADLFSRTGVGKDIKGPFQSAFSFPLVTNTSYSLRLISHMPLKEFLSISPAISGHVRKTKNTVVNVIVFGF